MPTQLRLSPFQLRGFFAFFFFFNHSPTLLRGKFISSTGENHVPIPSHGSRRDCDEIPKGIPVGSSLPGGISKARDRKGKSKNTGTFSLFFLD